MACLLGYFVEGMWGFNFDIKCVKEDVCVYVMHQPTQQTYNANTFAWILFQSAWRLYPFQFMYPTLVNNTWATNTSFPYDINFFEPIIKFEESLINIETLGLRKDKSVIVCKSYSVHINRCKPTPAWKVHDAFACYHNILRHLRQNMWLLNIE